MNTNEKFFQYHQLIVDSQAQSLNKVISWFEALQKPFIPRQVWVECQTMLGEAFDNVLVHAHEKLPQETPVDIEVIILSKLIILKIWDFGLGFNIEKQKKTIIQGVNKYAENGRGIDILREASDYINYINNKERNCLLIIKMFVPIPIVLQS